MLREFQFVHNSVYTEKFFIQALDGSLGVQAPKLNVHMPRDY